MKMDAVEFSTEKPVFEHIALVMGCVSWSFDYLDALSERDLLQNMDVFPWNGEYWFIHFCHVAQDR